MDDVFTIQGGLLPDGTRVVGFRGTEGISTPYIFEIFLSLDSDGGNEFDLGDTVGARATLTLDRKDGRPPFQFHGLFSELQLVHELGGRALVRAVLVPKLWHLTQTHHSRIFTKQSIPDIIKATLEDGGLTSDDYTLKLSQTYAPEEHVCQYQESDFDFISRWMEREGLYYYFEQGDSGEKLIITDNKSFHDDMGTEPIRFYPITGSDASAKESLHSFACRHRVLPGSVRFKDYDHTKPKLDVSGGSPVSKTGLGEINIYGARFFTPEAGKKLATLRAEEMLAREVVYTGSGTAFYLRPGYTFKLDDYARSPANTKYLPTLVEHYGNQTAKTPEMKQLTGLELDDVYRVDVTAIPDEAQFRAERKTPWPRVYGTEHGTIDGEANSQYAQIDEHGRYLVRFAFDESSLDAGKASTRVRMMQPHGGGIEGWHFPLRKGTEVLFTFLGGDPDRPVIAGVVPNALTQSPVTAANHTKNVIQTGGRNRLEIEDKAGQERITLSTPHTNTYIRMGSPNLDHNMIVSTDGDTLLHAGANLDVTVGGYLTEYVEHATDEKYHGVHTTTSQNDRHVFVTGIYQQTCASDVTRHFTAGYTFTVDADVVEDFKTQATTVTGAVTQKFGGPVTQTFGATKATYASLNWTIPGGAVVTTPKWNVTAPSQSWLSAHEIELHATKKAIVGHSVAITGFSYAVTAEKLEITGIKIDLTATKLANNTTNMRTLGAKISTDGLYSALSGIFSFA